MARWSIANEAARHSACIFCALHIAGHTTELRQQAASLEVDHRKLLALGVGADVALKVADRVRAESAFGVAGL